MDMQELIRTYTKEVARRIYGLENVEIVFYEPLYSGGEIVTGLAEKAYDQHFNVVFRICYNGLLFKKGWIPPHTWLTIVHEVTHYESAHYSEQASFIKAYKRNIAQTRDLQNEFNNSVLWDEAYDFESLEEEEIQTEYSSLKSFKRKLYSTPR